MIVTVVGAGASGTLTAVHLLRRAAAAGVPLTITLVDRAGTAGRGVAYGTSDPRHRLNVPAGRMSAYPDEPRHLVRWLGDHGLAAEPADFVTRSSYGRYLDSVLAAAERDAPAHVRLERVAGRAVAVRRYGDGDAVVVEGVGETAKGSVVLALGNFPPADPLRAAGGVPPGHTGSYVVDPWAPGALDRMPAGPVLLVGTGLTMVDVALTLAARSHHVRMLAASRHGLLPLRHATTSLPSLPSPVRPGQELTTGRLLAAVRRAVAGSSADWRAVVDALRPATQELWRCLPAPDRERFVRHVARYWEVHRHRMAPAVADELDGLLGSGRLRVVAGRVAGVAAAPSGMSVRIAERTGAVSTRAVAAVVNCTGPQSDMRRVGDPLVDDLLAQGLARPGPLAIGLDVDRDGRLLGTSGAPDKHLTTIGPLRRGVLLETTAIPEIRTQAVDLALRLVPPT